MVSAAEMPFVPNAEIREGATTRLDLDTRWKDDLAVRGRLLLGGKPGASLRFFHALEGDAVTFHSFVADDAGAFEVDGIPAGKIRLMLKGEGGWAVVTRAELASGEILTLE